MTTYGGEAKAAGAGRFGVPQFELEDRVDGPRYTLALTGELDMACSPVLEGRLRQICAEEGIEEVLLDLSRLAFIDSTGLRAILLAEELCERRACKLAMVPGQPQVQRLFEVSGLVDRLPFRAPVNDGAIGTDGAIGSDEAISSDRAVGGDEAMGSDRAVGSDGARATAED